MNLFFEAALKNPIKANGNQTTWHDHPDGFQYVITVRSAPEFDRPVWHLSVFAGDKILKLWTKTEIEKGLALLRGLAAEIGDPEAPIQGGRMALNYRRLLNDDELSALSADFLDSHQKYHAWYLKAQENKQKRQANAHLN